MHNLGHAHIINNTEEPASSPSRRQVYPGREFNTFDKPCYTDDECVEANSVMVMHNTERNTNSNLCQYRVSGN